MATSGSTNFTMTRDDIIKAAMRLIYVAETGETPSAQAVKEASECANLMLKSWMADGLHLWTQTEATLFCTGGQASYSLPGSKCAKIYTETTLTADVAISATALIVDSIAGITAGDQVGILLNDNTMHWTTVSGSPSGVTVNITSGLPSASSSGKQVYTYISAIERPLRIRNLRSKNLDGIEVPFAYGTMPMSRDDYFRLPNKANLGTPLQGYYDPQLTNGVLYVWPVPSNATHRITFTYERTIEDFDNIADNADVPVEWLNAIKWNLAIELAPDYNITPSAFVINKALDLKDRLLNFDRDTGSTYFSPRFS
jgi:hypothetical protein